MHFDIVISEYINVQQAIDVRHRLFEICPHEAANNVRAMTRAGQAVIIITGDAGRAESAERGSQPGRLPNRFEHANSWKIDPCAAARPSRRPGVKRHHSSDGVHEMVGQAPTYPSIGIRQIAVQPQTRRFDSPT